MTFIIADNGKPQAEKNHHDDLVMSLALAVHSYKNLLDSTPIEFDSRLNKDEAPPLPPSKMYKHSVQTEVGTIAEEDYKWLTE